MHERIERVGCAADLRRNGPQEGVREPDAVGRVKERVLKNKVQGVKAGVSTEDVAQHLYPVRAQPFTRGQHLHHVSHVRQDAGEEHPVLRIFGKVFGVACAQPGKSGLVHLVCRPRKRAQAAGEQRLTHTFRGEGQVRQGAKTAVALAKNAPRLRAQLGADQFGVGHNVGGPEMGKVVCLRGDIALQRQALPVGGRGKSRAALIKHEHAEVLGSLGQPAVQARGPVPLAAGTALQEQQPRQLGSVKLCVTELPRKERNGLPFGVRVVKGCLKIVVLDSQPADGVRRGGA